MATGRFKQFKVDFYVVTIDGERQHNWLTGLLADERGFTDAISLNPGDDEKFQIRSIVSIKNGEAYKAVFGRCRFGETPEQGAVDGSEDDVKLKPGYGLVEKNHFLFYPSQNMIVYQRNQSGSHYSKFQRYVARVINIANVAFEPILTGDSYKKLLDPQVKAKKVDLSFLPPKDPSLYPKEWTKDAIKLINRLGGVSARITIGVGRTKRQGLLAEAKDVAVMLARAGLAKVAKVKIDDQPEPIDLIADRVVETAKARVGDNGRLIPEMVYSALDNARHKRRKDINHFFGT